MTPEERRDASIAELIEAGLVVTETAPLADPADPHVVVAYRISVLDPTNRSRSRLDDKERDTEVPLDGLIPWTPAPEPIAEPALGEEEV